MIDLGSYVFGTNLFPGNLPKLTRWSYPWILAEPYAKVEGGTLYQYMTIFARFFMEEVTITRVKGEVKADGGGPIRFLVSKAPGEWWINSYVAIGQTVSFEIFPNETVSVIAFVISTAGPGTNYRALFQAKVDYVPLPATLFLLASGLAGLSLVSMRKR